MERLYLPTPRVLAWGCLLLAMVLSAGGEGSSAWAVNLKAEVVTLTGLSVPGFGAAPPGESGVLYITEQNNAAIKILDLETKGISTFLDLPDIAGSQAGLSAVAFHPDYANNGKFYLNVFDSTDSRVKIIEYQRSAENPQQADINTRREIYSFENLSNSHNGGWLGFSPVDHYLYIATGDGGAIAGPTRGLPAQDLSSPKGKILRIDVDVDDFPLDDSQNYGVPQSNPFEIDGVKTNVFALGLRHPFRASFDRVTGDMYIGDVGSSRYEEVNLIPANSGGGQNFGWRPLEGPFDNPTFSDPPPPGALDPIHYYPHGSGAAVIGGYVYRGAAIPDFVGHYIYVDNVTNEFGSFVYDGATLSEYVDRTQELAHPIVPSVYNGITSFGEDADGELYFFDRLRGDVFKIVAGPVDGDFDGDGDVDGDDLMIWQEGYGIDDRGDADHDADTDSRDFLIWQRNYTGSAPMEVHVVPEPAGALLAGVMLAAVLVRRTRDVACRACRSSGALLPHTLSREKK